MKKRVIKRQQEAIAELFASSESAAEMLKTSAFPPDHAVGLALAAVVEEARAAVCGKRHRLEELVEIPSADFVSRYSRRCVVCAYIENETHD